MAPGNVSDDKMNIMMNNIHKALGGDQDYAGYREDPENGLYTLAIGNSNENDLDIWIDWWLR
jgi:hypothetical protein